MGVSSALSSFGCIDLSAAGGGSTSKGNALASAAITGTAGTASTSATSHGTRGRCRLNAISSYSSAIAGGRGGHLPSPRDWLAPPKLINLPLNAPPPLKFLYWTLAPPPPPPPPPRARF